MDTYRGSRLMSLARASHMKSTPEPYLKTDDVTRTPAVIRVSEMNKRSEPIKMIGTDEAWIEANPNDERTL